MPVPVVQRIAPELPVRREVVGRHAGHRGRPPGFVELEELGAGVGVAAVGRDVDGLVPEEPHAFAVRVVPELRPLLGEQELEHLGLRDEPGRRLPGRPPVGRDEAVRFAQRGETAPRRQPARLRGAEAQEGGVLRVERHGAPRRALQGRAQLLPEPAVVGPPVRPAPQAGELVGREELARAEVGEVEEVGIAREDGKGLVGRVPVAGRPERADLPPAEARRGEEVDEAPRFRAQRADRAVARQRGGMQEHARATPREGLAGEARGGRAGPRGAHLSGSGRGASPGARPASAGSPPSSRSAAPCPRSPP